MSYEEIHEKSVKMVRYNIFSTVYSTLFFNTRYVCIYVKYGNLFS